MSEVRQKLRAKVLASVPPLPPPEPATEEKRAEDAAVVMTPVVVGESKLVRAVASAIERGSRTGRTKRFRR